ncbi:hypothetical protein I317_01076 [Kwoniella heveanensis CBS 569]|nr:hypothetical protein I317_01076 [Kwoniella heveanensis CBS 569]
MIARSFILPLLTAITSLEVSAAPTQPLPEAPSTELTRRAQAFSKVRLLPKQGSTLVDRWEVDGKRPDGALEMKTGETLVFNWDLPKLEQDKKDDYERSYQPFAWYSYQPGLPDGEEQLIWYSECQVSVAFDWQGIGEYYFTPFAGYQEVTGVEKDRLYVTFPPDQHISQKEVKLECKAPVCRGGDDKCKAYPMNGF